MATGDVSYREIRESAENSSKDTGRERRVFGSFGRKSQRNREKVIRRESERDRRV